MPESKFPPAVPEISRLQEGKGNEITVTVTFPRRIYKVCH